MALINVMDGDLHLYVVEVSEFDTKQTGNCQGLRGPLSGAVEFLFVILKG